MSRSPMTPMPRRAAHALAHPLPHSLSWTFAQRAAASSQLLAIVGGALVTAALAQIVIPLPFTPVPVTGQTLAVLLTGALLGARRGALAQCLYLALGALGMPLFAAGMLGPARLLGPTGGYLLAFPIAAWIVGRCSARGFRDRSSAILVFSLAQALIYALGLLWLARFVPAGMLLAAGLYPFLIGDALKLLIAASVAPIRPREDRQA